MPMPLDAPVISAVFLLVFIREEYVVQEPENAPNSNQCGHRLAGRRRDIRADEAAAHARNTFSDEARWRTAAESGRQVGRIPGDGTVIRREGSRIRSLDRPVGCKRATASDHIIQG